jgi:hypothetical protein
MMRAREIIRDGDLWGALLTIVVLSSLIWFGMTHPASFDRIIHLHWF